MEAKRSFCTVVTIYQLPRRKVLRESKLNYVKYSVYLFIVYKFKRCIKRICPWTKLLNNRDVELRSPFPQTHKLETAAVLLDCVWNVMAHVQKPDLVFRRNGQVYLNRRGRQFNRLLAAEVCASAVVMLGTLSSEVVWSGVKGTGYPLHSPVSPSLLLPCVTVCHHVSTGLYHLCESDCRWISLVNRNWDTYAI